MSEFDSTKDNEIIETNDDFENDEFVKNKIAFIERYKAASNTANATIDDNSNVFSRNVAIINSEIHKKDNTRISRAMVISKLKELYPNFNAKRYVRDLEDHVIYKHDESSFAGAIAPYTYSSKEVVYVKYNEKPYLIPFDLLYDIVKENEVLVDKDNIVYQKYPKNLYIYDKDNTWARISHITKKKRHRDLVRVKTYFGEDLVVTDNHPMIVDVDNTDNTVEAINSLGKKQYKTDTQFRFNNNDSVDLTNIFDGIKVYKDYVLYKDNNVTHLPVSISVDREFGKFIGLFIDRGEFKENSKSVEIEFDTTEDADKWSNYLQDKFNLSCLTHTYNDKVLIVSNEFLYDLLKEYFLIGDSIYNRTLPVNILLFNKEFALGIIEGLLNIDSLDNNSLYYQSPSRSLILQISAILKYFGYAIKNSHNLYDYDNTDISAWNVSAYKLSNIKDTDFYEYRMGGETTISDVYKLNDTDPFVESQNEFIYDITTSTRTFALNNILVHNCVSITMYPFLMDGIKGLGGLSASPKNLKSFCGIFCNMIFAISSQFAGAVAVSEALLYFTYFCKKEWGDDFYKRLDEVVGHSHSGKQKTILSEIQQYWQQIVYTINQPAAARGFQSAFVNFSYFDKPFFEGMFGEFYFPDGTKPDWESLKIIQMEFMKWFNAERLKTILTFPVETVTLLYKDGKFLDEDMYNFVCDEYERGHSFFTYISDTVDSLSSCCFEGDEIIKVYDKNNNAKSISIKEFVNMNDSSINESGCKINNDNGYHYIDSYNENGDTERTKITGTLKKESSKLYEFTINNKHIAVTGDHIMMVKDISDNEIKFVPAEFVAKDINRYLLATE